MPKQLKVNKLSPRPGNNFVSFDDQWPAKAAYRYNQVNDELQLTRNVSSASDIATGNYSIAFTNSFIDSDLITTGEPGFPQFPLGGDIRGDVICQAFSSTDIEGLTIFVTVTYFDWYSSVDVDGELA